MQEILNMSTKERQRMQVIGHLKHGKTTVAKAASALGLSERQMYRVLDRHHRQGDRGQDRERAEGHVQEQHRAGGARAAGTSGLTTTQVRGLSTTDLAVLTSGQLSGLTSSELGALAVTLNETFERLQTAFDRQIRFTADASHELRTPLSVIHSQAELSLSRERNAGEYKQSLETCLRAAKRMT